MHLNEQLIINAIVSAAPNAIEDDDARRIIDLGVIPQQLVSDALNAEAHGEQVAACDKIECYVQDNWQFICRCLWPVSKTYDAATDADGVVTMAQLA